PISRTSQCSPHGYAPDPKSASSQPCWEASTSSQRWCFPKASTTADSSAKSPRAHRPLQKASSSLTPSHQDRIGHPHENQPTPHGWPPVETEPAPHIDLTDSEAKVLGMLMHDGRTALSTLASAIGKSENTAARTIEQLRRSGVLDFRILVEPVRYGFATEFFLWLEV